MNDKIDFVLIWVDGNDPQWQKEKNKYSASKEDDDRKERYRDWENLKYWFRGVEKFAPWVNKVHFVTCGHIPSWLNLNYNKLNFVTHSDYMPNEYLPTFSANPIELNLHRIKDLSEHFVYFNDDTFIIDYIEPDDFFKNGLPCDNYALYPHFPSDEVMNRILHNNVSIINKYFKKPPLSKLLSSKYLNITMGRQFIQSLLLLPFKSYTGFYDPHLPNSFTKSLFKEVWEKEYDVLHNTSLRKFRNVSDVNQWLFRYWYLAQGEFSHRSSKIGKYFELSNNNEELFNIILKQETKMICCNDSVGITNYEDQKARLIEVFDKILPEKSSFEI